MVRLLVIPLLLLLATTAQAETIADGVAAQVGSDIVLVSEVLEAAAPTAARAHSEGASNEELDPNHCADRQRTAEVRLPEQ